MQHLRNQLNNANQNSEKSTNTHDLSPENVCSIMSIINEDFGSFENKYVVILNSKNGILSIGLKLLNCEICINSINENPSDLFLLNLQKYNLLSETIQSNNLSFKDKIIDLVIFGPNFNKLSDTSGILKYINYGKCVYVVFKDEHSKIIFDKFKNSKIIGSLCIQLPGSSNYAKQNIAPAKFNVFRIYK